MPPPFLYKYRQDSEFTKRIFIDRKIWLATPDALNDPAECKTGLIPDEWRRQKIAEMESAQLLGLFGPPLFDQPETLFSLDRQNTKRWFKRLKKLPHDRKIKAMRKLYRDHGVELSDPRILFETFQQQLSSVGIFSLSECPDSPPMWAHYAGNHSGLTLRFAVHEGNKLGDPIHTIPVTYSDTKPTFKSGFMHRLKREQTKAEWYQKGVFHLRTPFSAQASAPNLTYGAMKGSGATSRKKVAPMSFRVI